MTAILSLRDTAKQWRSKTSVATRSEAHGGLDELTSEVNPANGEAIYKIKYCLNFSGLLRRFASSNDNGKKCIIFGGQGHLLHDTKFNTAYNHPK